MKQITLVFLLLFVQAVHVRSQEKPFDLYLLAGQSNMAGRGAVEAQDTIIYPRVLTLNSENKWVPAQDPIHFDKSIAGVGLGRSFGIEMAKANPNAVIGLIPCAVGGTPIDAWEPGAYYEPTHSHPWDDMEKRLKAALHDGVLKGILWHQGESDANPKKSGEYKEKLTQLIKRIRTLAGDQEVPFVAGELGKFKIKSNKTNYPELKPFPAKMVMQSTKEVVRTDKNAAFVKSNGLNHKGDSTHFNSESYRKLGKRYARAMQKLQKNE